MKFSLIYIWTIFWIWCASWLIDFIPSNEWWTFPAIATLFLIWWGSVWALVNWALDNS